MATLRKSQNSTFNSHSFIFFFTLFFLFLIFVQSSSDHDNNSDHSSSATATINLNSRKIPTNPRRSSSSSSSSSSSDNKRQFEASEHAVPSGPNPTSNRSTSKRKCTKRKETSTTAVHPHRENLSPQQAQPWSAKPKTHHNKPHSQPPQRPQLSQPEKIRNVPAETRHQNSSKKDEENKNIAAQTFTYRELATATKNFRQEYLIGEGGFGRVYKGRLDKTGQVIAVKQLDRNGLQGNREFLVEVLMLSLLHDTNLVNLIGYCADGDQRLLVYEYMPLGALEDHLFDLSPDRTPLDWFTRMKIALNAAKGLEYLHHKANPPVIYRDLKSSNILLDKEFNAKLSDFGLAKLGPMGDNSHVSSRVMGTYGYCAPEYQRTGQLTVKSDVYSFGVVLLELITGKRAVDTTKNGHDQILVAWAEPIFKDTARYTELADPLLKEDFPKRSFNQAVAIAAMCLQEDPAVRPLINDVVTALSFLWAESSDNGFVSYISPDPLPDQVSADNESDNEEIKTSATERQRAVAEAIEWGSNSRTQNERLL